MSEQNKEILEAIKELKLEVVGQLKLIDKRLSLIEQRLANIEPFISVDNKALEYHPA